VDRDFVELSNLQRQLLFDEEDVAALLPKAVAAAAKLRRINSDIQIEEVVADVSQANIRGLVADADVILDGTDNFSTRYLINDISVQLGKPWIYCGVVAAYGMTMTIRPGTTPCLRCVIGEIPAPGATPTCETAGIVGPIVSLIGSVAATEAIKLIVGQGVPNRGMVYVDLWEGSYDHFELGGRSPSCPACGTREFPALQPSVGPSATALCGRDAVQVSFGEGKPVDLAAVADQFRSARLRDVRQNDFLVRANAEGCELTLFRDGRAIIKGTNDEVRAMSLYSRFIGM
jgi:adenylyltransferase/sulfurtransferase